ncbi:metallophosphoesterase [Leptolyngbya sp. CCY15150]|uniref:metallophosphoesterase family protein n=1 Tax=Leptolyngbya sp. CCY15150 TaxID=2767772 RepID=UPI00194DB4B1|nr:metallophosphoesterase [Leptolyngbya sp. CCY15150]
MGWRRVWLGLVGFLLTVSLSCAQAQTPVQSAAPGSESPAPELSVPQEESPDLAMALPSSTVAIAATAGPAGLYDPPRGDVRLAVISDLNSAYGSTDYDPEVDKAIELLPFWQPDLVVCSGDMIAGQSLSLSADQVRRMWDAFDAHVAAPLRTMGLPFGFTVGNHDASASQSSSGGFTFQQERDLAQAYWQQPNQASGLNFQAQDDFPFYYSFVQNDIFFLAWDGSSSRIPADKLAWVERELASPAAQQANLRIMLGHLPLYAVAEGRNQPGEVMDNADELRQMMERHNVHTYISGHHHAYYPAHKGNLQLLHTGLLGSGPRSLLDQPQRSPKTLTVVDITFDAPEPTTYTTYDIQTLAQVENAQLPRLLTGHNGMVMRRDVAWDDLSTTELSFCEQRLGAARCGR